MHNVHWYRALVPCIGTDSHLTCDEWATPPVPTPVLSRLLPQLDLLEVREKEDAPALRLARGLGNPDRSVCLPLVVLHKHSILHRERVGDGEEVVVRCLARTVLPEGGVDAEGKGLEQEWDALWSSELTPDGLWGGCSRAGVLVY